MNDPQFFGKWVDSITDYDSIRILLYLRQYNPDVKMEDLEKELGMDKKNLALKIANLIDIRMVKYENDGYRLTYSGRIAVNKLMSM